MRDALGLFITLIFISASTMANIQSTSQLYIGEKQPESCGEDARVVTKSELERIDNFCADISLEGNWKIYGEDGTWWSLLSNGYSCDFKPDADPQNPSLCVMRSHVPADTAYLFAQANFKGNEPWDGRASISSAGEQVTKTQVKSFRLGRDVELVAYPKTNFNGSPQVFVASQPNAPFEIRSYKLDAKNLGKDITIGFRSGAPKACITLVFPNSSPMVMCRGGESKILTKIKGLLNQIMVEIYLFTASGSEPRGTLYLVFDKKGVFTIDHSQSRLPKGLSAKQQGQELMFLYH